VQIAVIGRGNLGGGLARLWRASGHEVVEIGSDGGDASGAEAVLLAVPSAAIADALGSVSGIGDTPVIDATNLVRGDRPEGFESLAEYVKSLTGGPVAKAFNTNFARLYDRLGEAKSRPGMLYAADEDAREVTEQLIRAAGYEPLSVGGLESARAVEDFLRVIFAVAQERGDQVVYRFAPPNDL
jgi:predicted dinucleotide-binding enzyme